MGVNHTVLFMTLVRSMTLFSAFLLGWLGMTPSLQAQSEATSTEPLEKSLLWKVTGKGIKPSYIFGTIHIISADDYMWTPTMDKALKKTKKLVTEIDMSQQLSMAVEMMRLAPMKDGKTLEDLLSKEDYALVKRYFTEETKSKEAKMTFSIAQTWQPMLLLSALYTEMIDGPVKMYEMELTQMAKKADMEFGGLETVEDQMNVFHGIPYDEQAKTLLETVKELQAGDLDDSELQRMIKQYKTQDVDGMLDAMDDDLEEMGNQEALIDDRKKNWIPQIIATSRKTPTFYAVGAGHLGGEKGVIRLLRKQGYKVTPVR